LALDGVYLGLELVDNCLVTASLALQAVQYALGNAVLGAEGVNLVIELVGVGNRRTAYQAAQRQY
jgi:hypothetical protein